MSLLARIESRHWIRLIVGIAGLLWFVIAIVFLIFCIFALIYPATFENFSASMAFLGITAASLAIALFFLDKYDILERERIRDERWERIEVMVKKWDFD